MHPFDVVKVRMQVNRTSLGAATVMSRIYALEGVTGLYSGLSAAVTRQLTYTTLRLGLYDEIRAHVLSGHPGDDIPFTYKVGCGLAAGATASTLCCPIEVSLVRMQADGNQPRAQRRNYRHAFDALYRVWREEGIATLWRGVVPTVTRGAVVSTTQLATYDQAKSVLKRNGILSDGIPLHFAASLVSGFVYCWASLPLDICKTRMQDMRPDASTGRLPYRSIAQALYVIPKREGILALWKGFGPYFLRGKPLFYFLFFIFSVGTWISPRLPRVALTGGGHTIGMFVFAEQFKKLLGRFYN